MKWYEDLFVGESVTGKIKKIKWKMKNQTTSEIHIFLKMNLLKI